MAKGQKLLAFSLEGGKSEIKAQVVLGMHAVLYK